LAAVYAAAEVYQTQDTSPDFSETTRFLDSRLSDLRTAGESVASVTEWAGFQASGFVNVLRSKGMRI